MAAFCTFRWRTEYLDPPRRASAQLPKRGRQFPGSVVSKERHGFWCATLMNPQLANAAAEFAASMTTVGRAGSALPASASWARALRIHLRFSISPSSCVSSPVAT